MVTKADLNVQLERMPLATYDLLHVHDNTRQFYFILEGKATIDVGANVIELEAGSGIEIAPGTPHQMRNDSTQDLEFLVVSSGPPRRDRRDLRS
jgi:mannose-6-phosphate isomerase-like protein (cupin superfamily)